MKTIKITTPYEVIRIPDNKPTDVSSFIERFEEGKTFRVYVNGEIYVLAPDIIKSSLIHIY